MVETDGCGIQLEQMVVVLQYMFEEDVSGIVFFEGEWFTYSNRKGYGCGIEQMFEEDVSGIVLFEGTVYILQRWLKRVVVGRLKQMVVVGIAVDV